MSSNLNIPREDFFNDPPQQTTSLRPNSSLRDTGNMAGGIDGNGGDSTIPKPKRIACIICRKRKLKCDGSKPSCSTCTRLGHDCAYDPVRRKSGPKRGYVKALEERLKQVENMLKSQEPTATTPSPSTSNASGAGLRTAPTPDLNVPSPNIGVDGERWRYNNDAQPALNDMGFSATIGMGMGLDDFPSTWEMIGLGIEEPLPLQEVIDELHEIYFDNIHPSLPMIHKYRYLAAMNLAPNQRPPVSLRYAMWTLAASSSEKYMNLKDHFYQRARKYMEMDTLKGFGESIISVSHAQVHILLASYEFRMMHFPRAWMSTGAAIRLCQMMGLHRLDKPGLEVKQCLPPPRDWTEREERRRTFWMAFCEDRYASVGTGWPMTIDEKDITSDLPSSEDAFNLSKPERTQTLTDSMSPQGASRLSPFAGVVLMASLFGRNLLHLHRSDPDYRDNDLNGEFWRRHRHMDNILLNTSLSLPFHLRLPHGMANPNSVFLNMNIHASTICLHQAAIFKAQNNRLPDTVAAESKIRAISAANEITSIMKMISHMDLSTMNPFISFCLYVAARVFVKHLDDTPKDSPVSDALRFLLKAMNALKKKNPLTESFLVQLDVDLEAMGLRNNNKFKDGPWNETLLGSKETGIPGMGTTVIGSNDQTGCNIMRFIGGGGPDAIRVIGDSPTNPQETSRSISADTEQGIRRTSTSPRVDPFPRSFDVEQRGWPRLNERSQARDLRQGVPVSQSKEPNGSTYSHDGTSTDMRTGLSSNTGNNSNNPTLKSTSDVRPSNIQHGQTTTNTGSYETRPAPDADREVRLMDAFFSTPPGFNNIPAGSNISSSAYSMPETPGRTYTTPDPWPQQTTTGLTPVGEGVFRHMMGLGPMDPMDIWEGGH
ncbi:putative binuclear zinc transcription factor protein [Botrytis fragariae]|uniref:Putative binuclear zinc transcription factor protein n=1 Tax=Botrytis fragariae TaxID=1964551 RepID=A0A8H6AMF2_9HELO|nr:putative binuclear zinc transcription factor protein [Botrytis fragariae]KAF5870051.1 putative binuclear zinc transcription factor protein [Botrytis fragariae]